MTFEKLQQIIKDNNIPHNVQLQSDSGCECSETEMDGIYYDTQGNRIIFTQEGDAGDEWFNREGVYILNGINKKCQNCKYLTGSYCVLRRNFNEYTSGYVANTDTSKCNKFYPLKDNYSN